MRPTAIRFPILLVCAALGLSACFDSGGSSDATSASNAPTASAPSPATPTTAGSTAISISGTPQTTAVVGQAYAFQPTATASDITKLTFSITNKPAWATFDTTTGRLAGTPAAGDVGSSAGIVISVSNGTNSVSLAAFALRVNQTASGTATLSWEQPMTNSDGTAMNDLAGYRIAWGSSPGSLTQTAQVANPGVTTYVVQNLPAGTWYFTVKAYNGAGVESSASNVLSKTIT